MTMIPPKITTIISSNIPKIEMPIDKDILTKYKIRLDHDNDTTQNKEATEAT